MTAIEKKFLKHLMMLLTSNTFIWVSLFAIAMGMLESSVVIYLRELYYPNGFIFPLTETSKTVAITEIIREFATLIMLVGIGVIAGKNRWEQFAWFIYSFAIWDIFYYIFLYLILQWPQSLFTWDVLFLLPTMWVGPVWSPILIALLMIGFAVCILLFSRLKRQLALQTKEWLSLFVGSTIVVIAFCKDFYMFMTQAYPDIKLGSLFFSHNTFEYASNYMPKDFDMVLFFVGTLGITLSLTNYFVRNYLSYASGMQARVMQPEF